MINPAETTIAISSKHEDELKKLDQDQYFLLISIISSFLAYYELSIERENLIYKIKNNTLKDPLPTLTISVASDILDIIATIYYYNKAVIELHEPTKNCKQDFTKWLNYILIFLALIDSLFDLDDDMIPSVITNTDIINGV